MNNVNNPLKKTVIIALIFAIFYALHFYFESKKIDSILKEFNQCIVIGDSCLEDYKNDK